MSLTAVFLLGISLYAQNNKRLNDTSQMFEGIVKTIVFEDGQGTQKQVLDTGGKLIPLFSANNSFLNKKVLVSGKVDAAGGLTPESVKLLDPLTETSTTVSGLRTVLILLINFADDKTEPASVEEVRDLVFKSDSYSANAYYRQASDYKMSLGGIKRADGDVVGYITVPYNSGCSQEHSEFDAAANNAARQLGYEPAVYDSVVYVFPTLEKNKNFTCPASAYGTIGSVGNNLSGGRIWLHTALNLFSYKHEIGHNLGLHHSNSLSGCSSTQAFTNCTKFVEYGDPFDPMGTGDVLFNNYNRLILGWNSGGVATFSNPGTYYVNLYAPSRPNKRATVVKIQLKNQDGSPTGEALYLEFRRNAPLFERFNDVINGNAARGISIRLGNDSLNYPAGRKPSLIDTTPLTDSDDAPLLAGDTFANSFYGFSITTIGTNPMLGARVKIELTR